MVLGGLEDLQGGVTCWLRSSISIQFILIRRMCTSEASRFGSWIRFTEMLSKS
jgi:hypothetical protein